MVERLDVIQFSEGVLGKSIVDKKAKLIIILASVLILCNYYYLYFLSFDQGAITGSVPYSYVRLVGLFLLFSQILDYKAFRRPTPLDCCILSFISLLVFTIFIKWYSEPVGNKMIANMIICAVPLLLFNRHGDDWKVLYFLDVCLVILIFQCAGDWVIYFYDGMLWDNDAFIGGVGNPSSFGVIVCAFSAYVMLCKKPGLLSCICVIILQLGVVRTSALMPCLLMLALAVYCAVVGRSKVAVFATVTTIIICWAALDVVVGDHLVYKLNSVIYSLTGYRVFDTAPGVSLSISLRAEAMKEIANAAVQRPLQFVLLGSSTEWYQGVDSQFLTYLTSFGLISTVLFLMYVVGCIFRNCIYRTPYSKFLIAILLLFCGIFLTNRILDYYPVALFFFLATTQNVRNVSREV
jgi:hypothetical protein